MSEEDYKTQVELNESMQLFLDMLKQEFSLYETVYQKAEEQREAIEELDMVAINSIISQKQALLNHIEEIESKIRDLRGVWQEAKDVIDATLSKEIQVFLKEFFVYMGKLVEYEKENEVLFIQKNEMKEDELAKVRRSRQIAKAYSEQVHRKADHTDLEG